MPKTIVLCLDGTWDGPDARTADGASTASNVQKVFESLSGSEPLGPSDNEREITFPTGQDPVEQVAKYIHGVGDVHNVLARAVEGATGIGLLARIIRGYTYLSREFQRGDHIVMVGFSRGAYTARALAGFVAGQGLLDWTAMKLTAGTDLSYSAGLAAWEAYKTARNAGAHGILQGLADVVTSLHDRFDLGLHPAPQLRFVDDVPIRAVAVWDTVGALGIPDMQVTGGTVVRRDVFEFVDTQLSNSVEHGFHAIAIDEERADFTPTLWDTRDGVVQVLFPGAHGDVGGGYPDTEAGLSNCALAWMARQLSAIGVLFANMPAGAPDPLGVQHRPWVDSAVLYVTARRHFPPGLCLSQRVLQRVAATNVPVQDERDAVYRPVNLLNSYLLLDGSASAPHVVVVA